MTTNLIDGNARLYPDSPEPHGQAALILVESLIHELVEQKALSLATAVEVVNAASEVRRDIGTELGESPVNLQKSVELLQAISSSLQVDLPKQ